jgi:two-component system nitrate/nitrite response regulator NarL
LRILLAEDYAPVRKGIARLLATLEGVEVCGEACNGQEAVDLATKLNPDLIILDVTMPVLDGLSAAKKIRNVMPNLPILILSMHDGREMIRTAREVGAHGFVSKGEVGGGLRKAVTAVLQGKTVFPDGAG